MSVYPFVSQPGGSCVAWMLELTLLFSQETRAFPAPYQGYFFDPEHTFGFYEAKTTAAICAKSIHPKISRWTKLRLSDVKNCVCISSSATAKCHNYREKKGKNRHKKAFRSTEQSEGLFYKFRITQRISAGYANDCACWLIPLRRETTRRSGQQQSGYKDRCLTP